MPINFTIDEDAPVVVEFTPRAGVQQTALTPAVVAQKYAEALDSAMNAIHSIARRVAATVEATRARQMSAEMEYHWDQVHADEVLAAIDAADRHDRRATNDNYRRTTNP